MKDRIIKIIEDQKLTSAKFADEIGVQRSSISHLLSGRNNPSLEFVQKILNKYPEISTDWLLFGVGEMKKTSKTITSPLSKATPSLFDAITRPDEQKQGTTAKQPTFQPETTIKTQQPTSDQLDFSPIPVSIKPDKKQIERIVVFYADKTFKEYLPEE
jgi:transcriptional regulator with XRE-family HTH domain